MFFPIYCNSLVSERIHNLFMSRHLERLLKIDNLLRSSNLQTSDTLANALEVTERTIRSDLVFLRDRFHAPLEYKKNKGWYYTDLTWRRPSMSLSTGELLALVLGQYYGQSWSEMEP
jgi:predicted DNA-binding transcriptional regulator YafY